VIWQFTPPSSMQALRAIRLASLSEGETPLPVTTEQPRPVHRGSLGSRPIAWHSNQLRGYCVNWPPRRTKTPASASTCAD